MNLEKLGRQKINKINDVLLINLKTFNDPKGCLVPIESDGLIDIKRIFYVYNVPNKEIRGKHSHLKTNQMLICICGSIEVTCDDGTAKKSYLLDNPSKGLFVPYGIWAEERYLDKNSILMVLCDTKYNNNDYVFDYNTFLSKK